MKPNVSLVEIQIPKFTISQEDFDNRIYIPPDGENYSSDMRILNNKHQKVQVIIAGQKSWVIVNCNN